MFDLEKFKQYELFFAKEHERSFEILRGTGDVMISAPHSVAQTRVGRIKPAEPQTGVLAKMLHESLGCPVICKTKNCGDDANFDEASPYKQALAEYIRQNDVKFLLDLHLLAVTRDVEINIGTGRYKNVSRTEYVETAVKAFENQNIRRILIDTPFAASSPRTVSAHIAAACGISCLQIEINSSLVWPVHTDFRAKNVYDALAEVVTAFSHMV